MAHLIDFVEGFIKVFGRHPEQSIMTFIKEYSPHERTLTYKTRINILKKDLGEYPNIDFYLDNQFEIPPLIRQKHEKLWNVMIQCRLEDLFYHECKKQLEGINNDLIDVIPVKLGG